jgi:hypothetical protein
VTSELCPEIQIGQAQADEVGKALWSLGLGKGWCLGGRTSFFGEHSLGPPGLEDICGVGRAGAGGRWEGGGRAAL